MSNSWASTHDNQLENQDEPLRAQKDLSNNHRNVQFQGLAIFLVIMVALIGFKVFYSYSEDLENGRFFKYELMSLELIDFWKLSEEQMAEEQKDKEKKILDSGKHKISRQELGRNSWILLHMMTGGFPENIPPFLVKQFNAFLVLFGQMYPCKLCANHFMDLLGKEGLFTGETKKQLMEYLCRLHNKVNERLGHPQHNCQEVYQEWNTCGCADEAL